MFIDHHHYKRTTTEFDKKELDRKTQEKKPQDVKSSRHNYKDVSAINHTKKFLPSPHQTTQDNIEYLNPRIHATDLPDDISIYRESAGKEQQHSISDSPNTPPISKEQAQIKPSTVNENSDGLPCSYTKPIDQYSISQLSISKQTIEILKSIHDLGTACHNLDVHTPEFRIILSNEKDFPTRHWEVMNRRLLADILIVYTNNKSEGMYRKSARSSLIDRALSDFRNQKLSDEILNDPIASSQLFKKTHSTKKLFSEKTFLSLTETIELTDNKDKDQSNINTTKVFNILTAAEQEMQPDQKDRLTISMKIMKHAYMNAPEKPEQDNIDCRIAKNDLAGLFAECAFPTKDMSDPYKEAGEASGGRISLSGRKRFSMRAPRLLTNLFFQCTSAHNQEIKGSRPCYEKQDTQVIVKKGLDNRKMIMEAILTIADSTNKRDTLLSSHSR